MQTFEHLGNEREVRREPSDVGRIVMGHERADELEDTPERRTVDRNKAAADDTKIACFVDDEDPVREVVEPQRIEMQLVAMAGIEREQSRVPVPRAERCDDSEQLDEQLVPRKRRGASRKIVDLGLELLARDAAERIRMNGLDRLGDEANVTRGVGRRGWSGVRPGCKHHHGE